MPDTLAKARKNIARMVQDNAGILLTDPSAPSVAPTAAIIAQAGLLTGVRLYKYTFVYPQGETAPSPLSNSVTVTAEQVGLTVPLSPIAGRRGCIARNIYGTPMNGADGTQQLVGTIADNKTKLFTDNVPDASLGIAMPTAATVVSEYDDALQAALATYSQIRPQRSTTLLTGDTTGSFATSSMANFDQGFIEQLQVEYPIVLNGRPYFLDRSEWEAYRTEAGLFVRFLRYTASGQQVRFVVAYPHVLPATDSDNLTVWDSDLQALYNEAACECEEILASFYAQTSDNVLSDQSNYATKRREYEARATSHHQSFLDHFQFGKNRAAGNAVVVRA